MALQSMTGFGRGEAAGDGVKVEVELSSVNRKQFDLHLNMPRDLMALEAKIHAEVHAAVNRGHIKGVVRLSLSGQAQQGRVVVDRDLARSYIEQMRAAATSLGLKDDLSASSLLQLPEVVALDGVNTTPLGLWPLVERALKGALAALLEMRRTEGAVLEADITRRFQRLEQPVVQIRKRAPLVLKAHEKALKKRLSMIDTPVPAEDPTLQRELAIFADRCDISEELTRLDSHFKQVAKIVASRKPCGRSLDFLCQELFREINTIGSKANDAAIARQVIRFKAGLEAVREQVQNVE